MRSSQKIWFVLSALLLLAACRAVPKVPPTPDIPTESGAPASETVSAPSGKGRSLGEAGYELAVSEDVRAGETPVARWSAVKDVVEADNRVGGLKGSFTKVSVYFQYLNGADEIPIMYLQCFDTPQAGRETPIYEDGQIWIYDRFPEFYPDFGLEEQIHAMVEEVNAGIESAAAEPPLPGMSVPALLKPEDYQVVLQAAYYYYDNVSALIRKKPA